MPKGCICDVFVLGGVSDVGGGVRGRDGADLAGRQQQQTALASQESGLVSSGQSDRGQQSLELHLPAGAAAQVKPAHL